MRTFNVNVNGVLYQVEVEEIAAGAAAPAAAPARPAAGPRRPIPAAPRAAAPKAAAPKPAPKPASTTSQASSTTGKKSVFQSIIDGFLGLFRKKK